MRKRMSRQPGWLGILLAMGLVIGVAEAGIGGPRGERDGEHPRWERLFERLDLTEEQLDKVKEVLAEKRSAGMELHKEELRLRNEVEGEMLADSPDVGEVAKLVRRIGEIRAELELKRLEGEIAVRSLLTDEQRDRLLLHRERIGPHKERMGCHRERMGCGGPRRDCLGHGGHARCERWEGRPPAHCPRAAEPGEVD
jgi:Spy/CpxP family protein refolding chaperone